VKLFAAGLAALMSVQAPGQTAWTELRGERFVLLGTLDADRLRPVACEVQLALRTVGITREGAPVPSIIAAANGTAMREVLPQYWERRGPRPLAAYWAGLYGHHIALRVDTPPEERLRRLLHEAAHFATHLAHPKPPRWLDEGTSELWEHAAIDSDRVEIGRPVARHLRALRSDKYWIPVAELAAATEVPRAASVMFYAQSWALVNYLLFEKPGNAKLLLEHLPGPADLPTDEELRRYARGPLARHVGVSTSASIAECRDLAEVRSVPLLESLLFRSRALADGERPDTALPLLRQVLRHDPDNAEALEILGFVHFIGNRFQESARAFDGLIGMGRGSHIAYYYRAMLAGPVPALSDGSGPVPEIEYLRRAIGLSPSFRPAVDRLCEKLGKLSGCTAGPAVPH